MAEPSEVVQELTLIEELHDAATQAVLDALSWMDPETAKKWRAESSYKRLVELLRRAALECHR